MTPVIFGNLLLTSHSLGAATDDTVRQQVLQFIAEHNGHGYGWLCAAPCYAVQGEITGNMNKLKGREKVDENNENK